MANVCQIRLMREDDLERVLGWRNHPDIRRYMLTQHEISLEEHCIWFARASQDPSRRLLIVEEGEVPLGYVQFTGVVSEGIAHWGFYAAPKAVKGSGRKLGQVALDYGFQALRLHKICGEALAFNEASITFHTKLGFRQEGVLRNQCQIAGIYYDLICFGLLGHEWRNKEGSETCRT